jgi:hypothetical protein
MSRDDITRMAREAGLTVCRDEWVFGAMLERFAALVAAAEREAMMQLFTDPENQPTQYGTVTVDYMQREIATEREVCAKVCDDWYEKRGLYGVDKLAAAIRARGQA